MVKGLGQQGMGSANVVFGCEVMVIMMEEEYGEEMMKKMMYGRR